MKKISLLLIALCLLFAGCANSQQDTVSSPAPVETSAPKETADVAQAADAKTVFPLPDTTMDNLSDAILSVSLEKADVYVDNGLVQMKLKIYSYDKYDMVDIATLQPGDIIVTHSGELEVASKEQNDVGTVLINGGLEAGGFDLVTNDGGIFYESGYNDAKNWYEIAQASFPVSEEFVCVDNADPDKAEMLLYSDSFLTGEIENFYFAPSNTSIRLEGGRIVEMNRVYIP